MKNVFDQFKPLIFVLGISVFAFLVSAGFTYYRMSNSAGVQNETSDTLPAELRKLIEDSSPPPPTDKRFTDVTVGEDEPIRGNKEAKIVLIEYTDFECPFCQRFHSTAQQLVSEYDGQVAWVIRQFPLGIHAGAPAKAEASICVLELGGNDAFWLFADSLFEDTQISPNALIPLAIGAGVDASAFESCTNEGRKSVVDSQFNNGVSYGVTGTPGTLLLNTETGEAQLIEGSLPFESFKQIIDSQL